MKSIILLGAPGAGKGTVAGDLADKTPYQHISTGDMLRAAVKSESSVGKEAKSYMEKGELVPDNVIAGVIRERLSEGSEEDSYMFDGFPRTLEQAKLLEEVMNELGGQIVAVFSLEVPEEVIIQRLTGRRVCRDCGAVYHVKNIPPKKEGVCDLCGGELYQRSDDTVETVKNRIAVYWEQTAELIGHYEEQGLLKRIDADQGKEKTEEEIVSNLRTLESR